MFAQSENFDSHALHKIPRKPVPVDIGGNPYYIRIIEEEEDWFENKSEIYTSKEDDCLIDEIQGKVEFSKGVMKSTFKHTGHSSINKITQLASGADGDHDGQGGIDSYPNPSGGNGGLFIFQGGLPCN